MYRYITAFIVLGTFFFNFKIYSQQNILNIEIAAYGGGATDSLQPMWNWANRWGTFSHLTKGEGILKGKVFYHFFDKENISMAAGVTGVAKSEFSESFVQEAFLRMKFWWFDVSMGMEAYSPVSYDDNLSSGMFLYSSNARPIPRVTAGIFEYLPLGFTKKWIEIRGAMSQGFLIDDRGVKGTSNILLHEKWAYIRLGNIKWKPYAGIIHSALFGGTKPDGTKIPIDFWSTFLARPSDKIDWSDSKNAAGAHMGLWDFGLYFPVYDWQGQIYYQKPFADGSGMRILNFRNKDFYLGVLIKIENKKVVNGISVEFIKTSWQSGPGTADPYDPVEQHIVLVHEIEDIDAYMLERFGEETKGWTNKDLTTFLKNEWNYGFDFGGRDGYYNNSGSYYAGWTYNKLMMGTPLYHSADQMKLYAYSWEWPDRMCVVNNRVNGIHVGAEGWINNMIFYRFKGTYTNNYGNYEIQYSGKHSWEETPNYFFEENKNQFYTGLELTWKIKQNLPLTLSGVVGYDFGELYNSFGGRFGIVYKISPF